MGINKKTDSDGPPRREASDQNLAEAEHGTPKAPTPVAGWTRVASDVSHLRGHADAILDKLLDKLLPWWIDPLPLRTPFWPEVSDMLDEEKEHIARLRDIEFKRMPVVDESDLFGLALSGGGIRSATFSLGVLQALAQRGWVRKVDYLSTVSGGGYIGCWLSALIQRERKSDAPNPVPVTDAIAAVEKLIATNPESIRQDEAEPREIRFLRAYSNYLTPRLGVLSGDTLAPLAGLMRNFSLNLLLGVSSILVIVAAIHGFVAVGFDLLKAGHESTWSKFSLPFYLFGYDSQFKVAGSYAIICFVFAFVYISMFLTLQSKDPRVARGKVTRLIESKPRALSLLPLGLGFVFFSIWFVQASRPVDISDIVSATLYCLVCFGFGGGLAYFYLLADQRRMSRSRQFIEGITEGITSQSESFLSTLLEPYRDLVVGAYRALIDSRRDFFRIGIAALICGAAAFAIVLIGRSAYGDYARGCLDVWRTVHVIAVGPAVAAAVFGLLYVLWMGVVGNIYSEFTREWLNRLLGELAAVVGGWVFVSVIVIHARPASQWVEANWRQLFEANVFVITIGIALAAAGLGFALGGRRTAPERTTGAGMRQLTAASTPWFSVIAIACALVVSYQYALISFLPSGASAPTDNGRSFDWFFNRHISDLVAALSFDAAQVRAPSNWPSVAQSLWLFASTPSFLLLAATMAVTIAGFFCVDVNTFSLQNLYRNRLVRCYLGAVNDQRIENPYTGFDPRDDLPLKKFEEQRPYLLINATLNITHGESLAWQQRKAASFVFSPRWCGFWLPTKESIEKDGKDVVVGGYVGTENFVLEPAGFGEVSEGVMVGTAMATSGAAVSSQMGFASRKTRAFFLTLFNMRLGRWVPNTGRGLGEAYWKRHSPRFDAHCYLSELFGRTTEKYKWIYLSDGGHFENLGIYELVRRRCRRIICVDAGADPQRTFGDLGNAVQKCRVDFGVNIEIDTRGLTIDATDGRSETAFTTGAIDYPKLGNSPPFKGTLLYIKPSIPKGWEQLPTDIVSYRARHPEFPHEPTHDQWFTEGQFESYRQLGYLIGLKAIQNGLG